MNCNERSRSKGDVISEGKYVLIQRGGQDKIIEFKAEEKLKFGKGAGQQEIELQNAEGLPFYSSFRVQSKSLDGNTKKRCYYLEPIVTAGPIFNPERSSSGKDNRNIIDDNKSQPLGQTDIAVLREKGISGPEILDTLITRSKTFTQKTEFSQEKYLKKKERAYGDMLLFIKPTLSLVADYYFKKDPVKIMNLRADSLSQLLTYSNVYSGGKYIVYETACSGLIISGVLQRLGGNGVCLHVHTGSTPQRQALYYMNFTSDELTPLQSLDVFYIIRSAVACETADNSSNAPLSKKAKLATEDDSKAQVMDKDAESDTEEVSQPFPRLRSINRLENEKSATLLKTTEFDGLIICAKEHPLSILEHLLPRLKSSSPFAIFCQYAEPLGECFTWLKEGNYGINLNIFENWYRNIQIQPERTHPEINMSSNGGYILTGLYIKL